MPEDVLAIRALLAYVQSFLGEVKKLLVGRIEKTTPKRKRLYFSELEFPWKSSRRLRSL